MTATIFAPEGKTVGSEASGIAVPPQPEAALNPAPEVEAAPPVQTSRGDTGRVESLLRQLNEQKQATMRAVQSTLAIEKQLAETRQELNRALMMATVPPNPPASAEEEDGEEHPELILQRAQEELETERRARNDDRVVAAAHITRLEEIVVNAQAKEKTARDTLRRGRVMWIGFAAVFALAVAALMHVAARYPGTALAAALRNGFGGEKTVPAESAEPERRMDARQQRDTRATATAPENTPNAEAANIPPQAALESALARMNRALAAYPDEKPEQIIDALHSGRINIDPSSCLLAWNEGEPELLLQDRTHDRMRIAQTLSACASAIEDARENMIFGHSARAR